jgi:hypothetical protein
MSKKTGADYSEVYREKEIRQLKKRIKATQKSLIACSALILLAGSAFKLIFPAFNFLILTVYLLSAFIFLGLASYSRKKPYKSILWAMGLLLALWVTDIALGENEMILEFNILKLLLLTILIFSLKPAREAFIIRKDLHLS